LDFRCPQRNKALYARQHGSLYVELAKALAKMLGACCVAHRNSNYTSDSSESDPKNETSRPQSLFSDDLFGKQRIYQKEKLGGAVIFLTRKIKLRREIVIQPQLQCR
jgi:hypothetical protein